MSAISLSSIAQDRIFTLAAVLEHVDDRQAFIAAAIDAVSALEPGATGPGSVHRTVAAVFRQHFRPPTSTAPIEPARQRNSEAPREPRRLKPIDYAGQRFRSRDALSRYLAPLIGKDAGAISMALYKHRDDVDAVVRHYRDKAD